tara:strand:+ start:365 stop:1099 length:735 start_codon:yes stop_codon:yes gene_type:complete
MASAHLNNAKPKLLTKHIHSAPRIIAKNMDQMFNAGTQLMPLINATTVPVATALQKSVLPMKDSTVVLKISVLSQPIRENMVAKPPLRKRNAHGMQKIALTNSANPHQEKQIFIARNHGAMLILQHQDAGTKLQFQRLHVSMDFQRTVMLIFAMLIQLSIIAKLLSVPRQKIKISMDAPNQLLLKTAFGTENVPTISARLKRKTRNIQIVLQNIARLIQILYNVPLQSSPARAAPITAHGTSAT